VICVAQEAISDIATHAINFSDVTELLLTVAHNLARFEATVKQQVGEPLFAACGEQTTNDFP